MNFSQVRAPLIKIIKTFIKIIKQFRITQSARKALLKSLLLPSLETRKTGDVVS
jgi:hypothetical protein